MNFIAYHFFKFSKCSNLFFNPEYFHQCSCGVKYPKRLRLTVQPASVSLLMRGCATLFIFISVYIFWGDSMRRKYLH